MTLHFHNRDSFQFKTRRVWMNGKILSKNHVFKEECFTNLSWQSNHKQISKRLIFCSQIYMLWNSIIYYVEILFSDFFMSWRPRFIHSFIYKWDKIVSLCLLNGCGCFLKCMTNMRMIDNSCKSQFYSAVRLKVLKPESDSDLSLCWPMKTKFVWILERSSSLIKLWTVLNFLELINSI